MNIRLVLFFMLVFGNVNFYGHCSENHLCNALSDNIMKIWTTIDIVRAINTDNVQKNIFLEELINDSLEAYYLSRQLKREQTVSNEAFDKDIINLILSVQQSFEEVFSTVSSPNVDIFSVVFKKIIEVLKMPENIQSHITSQDIS